MDTTIASRLRHLAGELAAIAERTGDRPSSDDPTVRAAALARRFVDITDTGDLDHLDEVVHSDVTYVVSGRSPMAGVHEGIDAMRAALVTPTRSGATALRTALVDLVARPDLVITFHELSGTVDGRRRTFEFALRHVVRDGKIAEIAEFSADQHASDDLFVVPRGPSAPA